MKKLVVTLVMICAIAGAAIAQPRAIGARLGGNVEFSYQHDLAGGSWMMDFTLGATNYWNNWGAVGATFMFDKVWGIGASNWNWYLGPGFGVAYNYGRYWKDNGYWPVGLYVGGQIGIEYQFGIPLNISLDWRPMWNFAGSGSGYGFAGYLTGVALGLRYRF